VEKMENDAMKKPDLKVNGAKKEPLLNDSDFTAMLPNLCEYLITTQYEDGTTRQTSTLLIFVDEGVLKLCLNDREVGRTCFVTAETFEAALKALDSGLKDDTVDWRTKRQMMNGNQRVPF
jgi:hypothetical protein